MLAPWKKSYDQPRQHIKKQRLDCAEKAMVFSIVTYECESWTIKKVEHKRIDTFELWCWRRLLRVSWTPRKSVLDIHWKDWCSNQSSNTLLTWCKKSDSDAGKDWRQEEKRTIENETVGWHHWVNGHEYEQPPGVSEWVMDREAWCVLQSTGS